MMRLVCFLTANRRRPITDKCAAMYENARAFSRFFLVPRVMRPLTRTDPSTTILGFKSSIPVFVCGAALAKLGHPEGRTSLPLFELFLTGPHLMFHCCVLPLRQVRRTSHAAPVTQGSFKWCPPTPHFPTLPSQQRVSDRTSHCFSNCTSTRTLRSRRNVCARW